MGWWGKNGRFLPWLIVFCVLLVAARPALAQNSRLTLDAYWDTITQIRDDLREAGEEGTAVRLTAVASLTTITEIELADGRSQPIDHAFLIRQLQDEEITTAQLVQLLTAYLSSRLTWPEPTLPELDQAALDEILSQPEFQYTVDEPNFLQQLWQDIRQAVEDFFLHLFPEGSGFSLPVGNLLAILAAILVALVLLYALRDLITGFSADAAMHAEDELGGQPLTADFALQRAQELSTGGDYRTAVRYLYLSALLLLEERGLLRYDRSLTNREYLRTVAHQPELAAILREVIDVFDRVWYGFQTLTASEYEAYAQRVATLRQQKEAR